MVFVEGPPSAGCIVVWSLTVKIRGGRAQCVRNRDIVVKVSVHTAASLAYCVALAICKHMTIWRLLATLKKKKNCVTVPMLSNGVSWLDILQLHFRLLPGNQHNDWRFRLGSHVKSRDKVDQAYLFCPFVIYETLESYIKAVIIYRHYSDPYNVSIALVSVYLYTRISFCWWWKSIHIREHNGQNHVQLRE